MYRIGIYYPHKNTLPSFLIEALDALAKEKKWECTLYHTYDKPKGVHFSYKTLPLYAWLPLIRQWYYKKMMHSFFAKEENTMLILPEKDYREKHTPFKVAIFVPIKTAHDIQRKTEIEDQQNGNHILIAETKLFTKDQSTYIHLRPPYMDKLISTHHRNPHMDESIYHSGYFFCYCNDKVYKEDIFHLLRVFSKFKTRQGSSMKLVLGLQSPTIAEKLKLDLYKYKQDVIIYDNIPIESCGNLMRNAYACIYPFDTHDSSAIPEVLYAFLNACPLLCVDDDDTRILCEDAVAFFDRKSQSGLLELMKYIFVNEKYRNDLKQRSAVMKQSLTQSHNLAELKKLAV